MKELNDLKNELIYGDSVKKLALLKGIGLSEARTELAKMSFRQYRDLSEANIVPPSGQSIGPSSNSSAPQSGNTKNDVKSIWPGKGAPIEVGMTVGIKDSSGLPIPGTVSQVDAGAKGVKIKNPTTGQEEWANMDTLEPFMAKGQQSISQSAQGPQQNLDLQRLQELAGIKENCSAGATSAGAVAIAPTSMGKMKRRQSTEEMAPPVEYTPKEPAKTIIGDTKPNQASGKLSADLAARGKKTASRINNGRKR